jgi:hypothetical protein
MPPKQAGHHQDGITEYPDGPRPGPFRSNSLESMRASGHLEAGHSATAADVECDAINIGQVDSAIGSPCHDPDFHEFVNQITVIMRISGFRRPGSAVGFP